MTCRWLPNFLRPRRSNGASWWTACSRARRSSARLVARTYDGLTINPLYARAAGAVPVAGRAPGSPWAIMQRVDHPDPAAANAEALHDLENGATGLALVFAGSVGAYGYGLDAREATIARVLADVHLDAGIALDLDLSPQTKDAGALIAALVKRRGINPAATDIRFGFDPIGAAAVAGGSPLSWDALTPIFNAVISDLAAQGFRGPFAPADGRVIHNAGGSEAQELAYVLAVAATYLRALETGGVALDAARRMIYFRLAADADQFLTIAKFRALRKLWARVEQACGLEPRPVFVAAETAWRMMTQRDAYVNMLRETIAVARRRLRRRRRHHGVAVHPGDRASRPVRPAHRAQHAASAAGGIEPRQGGRSGRRLGRDRGPDRTALPRRLDAVPGDRAGGRRLRGTRGWPDPTEGGVRARRARSRRRAPQGCTHRHERFSRSGRSASSGARCAGGDAVFLSRDHQLRAASRLPPRRNRSRRCAMRRIACWPRPARDRKSFSPIWAAIADFTARATFAKNFFEAGGIEAVTNDGFESLDMMIAAFKSSGAKVACLCSSDAVYETEAVPAARALAAAGAQYLYLAGRPGEREPELRAAGAQSFIFAGCDVLATLRAAHDILGIANQRRWTPMSSVPNFASLPSTTTH